MIVLPWPSPKLSPNARLHWSRKADAVAVYRAAANAATKAAGVAVTGKGNVMLRLDFYPPDARRRDLDNMLASVKSGIDGIADALGLDDQRFSYIIARADPVKGGRVIVTIENNIAPFKPIGELAARIVEGLQ